MARRVHLHIGTMKSATSYLQELFNCNAERLADAGLLWAWSTDNFLAVDDLLGTSRTRPGLNGAWDDLAGRVRAHDGDALISNELLATLRPAKIRRLVDALAPAEVHVVVTARDLARTVPSQWQTGVRNGHTIAWSDFVTQLRDGDTSPNDVSTAFWRRHDLEVILRRWQGQVTAASVTLVTVPPTGADPSDVSRRFGAALGVDPELWVPPPARNSSLGAHSAELLRRLNEQVGNLDWLQYKWAYKNALSRLVLTRRADEEPTIQLDAAGFGWARARARQLVDGVRRLAVPVHGELLDLLPEGAAPQQAHDPSRTTAEELLEVAMSGLSGMGRVLADLRIEHEQLVEDLEAELPGEVRSGLQRERVLGYRRTLTELNDPQLRLSQQLRRHLYGERPASAALEEHDVS